LAALAFGLVTAFGRDLRADFSGLRAIFAFALARALVFGLALVLRLRLDLVGDAIVALRVMEIAS
jgi:hypothetical protein